MNTQQVPTPPVTEASHAHSARKVVSAFIQPPKPLTFHEHKPEGPEEGTFVREGLQFDDEPYIQARNLSLKSRLGYAYKDVNVDVHKGELVAVRGRNGSGKTALLLTLAGRMKPTSGTLQVGSFELPRQNRKAERHVGMALFAGLNDLQDSLTATYAAGAEFQLNGLKPKHENIVAYLTGWNLGDIADVRVKDLTSEQLTKLGIALAFVGQPDAVVVDDVEDQLTMSQSQDLVDLLIQAAEKRKVAVVMSVVERKLAAMAHACVYLSKEGE